MLFRSIKGSQLQGHLVHLDTDRAMRVRLEASTLRGRVQGAELALARLLAEEGSQRERTRAADHGIEPPEERAVRGKPEMATILMRASQRGNEVLVEVGDDGRGLNTDAILRKAIARGLVAKAVADRGAELAFTFQGEALQKRVEPLAASVGSKIVLPCDVTDEASMDNVFKVIGETWGKLDFLVHAIAFSDKEELKGKYVATTRENFLRTLDISCYSFTACAQRAAPLMTDGGALVTLTYYGAERVIPHYNVMGVAKAALEASVRYLAADLGEQKIRVNAISAGPVKTLAFAGIADGRYILKWNELNSPLKRNITSEEVGNAGLYLLSDLGTAVTGEVMHVDGGYHVVGMVKTSSAKQIAELLNGFEGE